MKQLKIIMVLTILTLSFTSFSQVKKVYNPDADTNADIKKALELAQKNKKHVFLQIGGNWCPWCIKFHNFIEANDTLKNYIGENFVTVKVNYDRDNKQEELLQKLDYPQRFGFPVFVVLDANGNRIHTQNSAFLEEDKSYSEEIVLRFFKNWSPAALDPASYKK